MNVTIISILTMCLFHTLLILVLILLFKINKVMKEIGPECMILLLLLVVVRMYVPLKFPFSYSIQIEDTLSPILSFFNYLLFDKPAVFTIWHLFVYTWAVGVIAILAFRFFKYRKVVRFVSLLPEQKWEPFYKKYSVSLEQYKKINIKIVYGNMFQLPCLIGLKHPYLILPKAEYSSEQIYYILIHEIMHVQNKDITWKLIIDVLCTAFWWNPVFWLLKKELFQMIEMRNDCLIKAQLSEEEQIRYMECLVVTAMQLAEKDNEFGVVFSRENQKVLKKRILLMANEKPFCRWKQVLVSGMVIVLLVLSTVVRVEPYSYKVDEESIGMTPNNTYRIKNEEPFDIYFEDNLMMITDEMYAANSTN